MRISRWGNSLAVRLPARLVKKLGLREGEEITLVTCDPAGLRRLEVVRHPTREALIEGLRQLEGRLPAGYTFNREEAHDRGRKW